MLGDQPFDRCFLLITGRTTVFEADPSFRPVPRRDSYLALEEMGLIGDGTTSALVGLDGSVPWLCLPRFDSEPLFGGLLDDARGGCFRRSAKCRRLLRRSAPSTRFQLTLAADENQHSPGQDA